MGEKTVKKSRVRRGFKQGPLTPELVMSPAPRGLGVNVEEIFRQRFPRHEDDSLPRED